MCFSPDFFAFVCFFFLGLAPWLIVNGVFCEVPILVANLPEGKGISSMLGAVVQLGNVAPVVTLERIIHHF